MLQSQKINIKSLAKYGWIVFLSISPIYFLPIIPIVILSLFKWTLFFLLICYSLFDNYGKNFYFPYGKFGILLLTLFFITIYLGIFNTISIYPDNKPDALFSVYHNPLFILKEYLPQITLFLIFYNYTKSDPNFYKILYYSAACFSLFVLYTLVSNYISFLDFENPYWSENSFSISTAGFSASKTNWNNAIAMFSENLTNKNLFL